jgi:probable HAF family extracellular repeat protein
MRLLKRFCILGSAMPFAMSSVVRADAVSDWMQLQTFLGVIFLTALVFAPWANAQTASQSRPEEHHTQKPRYKLIDIGTLGGPVSYFSAAGQGSLLLNNQGIVGGTADIAVADPNSPNCLNFDCFLAHTFRWKNGTITDLGAFPAISNSGASGINARGWIAGLSQTGDIDPVTDTLVAHAILWKNSEMIDLGTLGGYLSLAVSVNDGGQVVGFSTINAVPDPFSFLGAPIHPFIWENGVMRDIGTLGGPDALPSAGCTNQRSGLVAGGSFTNSTPNDTTGMPTQNPFLWRNGTMTDLGTLGGTFGHAQCANTRGQVIGQSDLTGDVEEHAFFWDQGILTDLGTLGGSFSVAIWLNDAGDVVGGATSSGDETIHATRWKHEALTDLGTIEGDDCSFANAINAHGQIVGASLSCATGDERAFLWEMGGPMVDLNTLIPRNSSLQLAQALNINDRGEILGLGVSPGAPTQDEQLNFFGHVFLLIPCDADDNRQCEDNSEAATTTTQNDTGVVTKNATTSIKARPTPGELVAEWRNRVTRNHRAFGIKPSN